MRIGIIGLGSIGGMLARQFAMIPNGTVRVYNRSDEKMLTLARQYENIELAGSITEVIRGCHVVFLCTKTADAEIILAEHGRQFTPTQVLASTISAVPIQRWEAITQAQVVKVIPSVTQSARSGVCLISYGTRFDTPQADAFEDLISNFATPFVVEESQVRVASDLTSCGPAFMAFLLLTWSSAAAQTDQLSRAESEHLLCQTLLGLSDLLRKGMTLHEVLARVAVPGGVTQAALEAITPDAQKMFKLLHATTMTHGATAHQSAVQPTTP